MDNTIILDFGEGDNITTESRYQYDYGQSVSIEGIELPELFEVHFANKYDEEVTIVEGASSTISIPDVCFRAGTDIRVWVFVHEESTDGRTVYKATIPVIRRPEPMLT